MTNIALKKIRVVLVSSLVLLVSLTVGAVSVEAFTKLTGQLSLGATGADVTNLQTFLASNASIYPQGLITGTFGPLTQQAVINFQNAYGISPVGRVGPTTLAKINSLIESGVALTGGVNSGTDVNAPVIYAPSVSNSRTSATISWSTSEPATSEAYYGSAPFQLAESTGSGEPTIGGATSTGDTTSLQTLQNVTLQNLQPNTLYYYMVESTDAAGNLQYTWPVTFMTTF